MVSRVYNLFLHLTVKCSWLHWSLWLQTAFPVQPRKLSPAVLDHNKNPRQSEQTELATISKPSQRQGEPFEKHSDWMSPEWTGRRGWQACWEPSKRCTSSFLWSGLQLFRAAASLILQWISSPGQQKLFSSSLETDRTKGRFGNSCTVTAFALSLTRTSH